MQLSFDPCDNGEVAAVIKMVNALTDATTTQIPGAHPVDSVPVTEAPVVINTPPNNVVPITTAPAAPEAGTSHAGDELDKHGMKHNDAYHSVPPKKNTDGSWKMRRGCREELDAAILAHKSALLAGNAMPTGTPAPAPTPEMTGAVPDPTPAPVTTAPMPVTTAPTPDPTPSAMPDPTPSAMPDPTPSAMPDPTPAPSPNEPKFYDYNVIGKRFGALHENGSVEDFPAVYTGLGIDFRTLPSDQRGLAALDRFCEIFESGQHDINSSIHHALQQFPIPQA